METRSLVQPLLRSVATPSSATFRATTVVATTTGSTIQRRHESSTARTKRALKIAPHPSFFPPSLSSGEATTKLIYNPPSSAASVYHTPFKFLPRSDPRRQANITQLFRSSADLSGAGAQPDLPPELPHHDSKYNVTREQVEEMRRLRSEDPERWSVLRLANRYDCHPLFVIMCCRPSQEHRDRVRARLNAVKAGWGPVRSRAREERAKRKALLLRDAL